MPLGIHVDVETLAWVAFVGDAVETAGQDAGLQQIGVGGTVHQPELEAAGVGDAHHMGAVVAAVGQGVGRPGGAGNRTRRVDALIAVHRRREDGAERIGVVHDAAQEVIGQLGEAHLVLLVEEEVLLASLVPDRDVGMATIAGQVGEGLGHKGGAQAVVLGDRFDHELEEGLAVGLNQAVAVVPVHLELAIGVLVVVLIRPPAERLHVIADLGDHIVAPHQGGLIVAGFRLGIALIRDCAAVGIDQKELVLRTGHHAVAGLLGLLDLPFEHNTRRGLHRLAVHPEIGGQPSHLRLPGQHDQAVGVGDPEHVRVGRRHVEPGGEAGEARAVLLHVADGGGGHQLGPQDAEEVDEADQKILYALIFCDLGQIRRHLPLSLSPS